MLIENSDYKRNKTGEIVQSQKVIIKCDQCGCVWESLYEYRKRKKHKKDLCLACRSKIRFEHGKINHPSQLVRCNQCGKTFKKYAAQLGEKNYCSKKCLDDSWLKEYNHLYRTFEQYPNELSYLCGLILGDGCLKKQQERTTKVTIAFDVKYPELLEYAVSVINKLQIPFHQNTHICSNCIPLSFSLPDELLSKYNMLWSGRKIDVQPRPVDSVINNIYFLGGLINSDGNVGTLKSGKKCFEFIRFVNICKSIIDCFVQCVEKNGFECKIYSYDPKIHKKTGKMQQRSYIVAILKQNIIQQIRQLLVMIKKPKNMVDK